jgi:hypothetical protein
LYTARKGAEIGDTLQFVIGKLYIEVVLQSREQVERLQAINRQSLEKIVVRREFFTRHFEVCCRQDKNFVERLILSSHISYQLTRSRFSG